MFSRDQLADIVFPKAVSVTEKEIDLSLLSSQQQAFYLDLFASLVEEYESKGKSRMVVGLAGPTGSGKSVIAAMFLDFANQLELPFRFATLGIDAFHYPNKVLESKEAEGKTLKDRKGAPDTYDVEKFVKTIEAFKQGVEVSMPIYSRQTHDPIEEAFQIDEEKVLLLVEGLWLLYDHNGWEKVALLLDHSIFVTAEKDRVKNTVVVRHMRGGRSEEEASAYYDSVDASNYDLVMATQPKAEKAIPSYHGA